MSRTHFSKLPLVVLALGIFTGALQATSLVANPTVVTVNCDTVLGPAPVTIGIELFAGAVANTVTVTSTAGTGATTQLSALPSPATVSSTSAYVNFTFYAAAGCKGITAASTVNLVFTLTGGATPLTVVATMAAPTTANGSALAPSPSAVTLLCTKSGSTYTAGSAQMVNVTSPAYLGTPFTVNTTAQTVNSVVETALPSWLTVTGSGTASATAVPLTITPIGGSTGTGCGALAVGATTVAVHLLNPPAADKIINVTIEVGVAVTTTVSPASTSLTYVVGSGTLTAGTPNAIISTPASYFSVDYSTVPSWLNVTPATGTAPVSGGSVTVTCTPTAGAESLALGTYTASVHLKIAGELDTVIPVTLQVKDPAATLMTAEGITRNVNWVLGAALPALSITPISSDSAIAYAITEGAGSLSPQVTATTGIAYSFGSAPIPVTFLQSIFGAATPGQTLTGTVVFTPTNLSIAAVTVTIHVAVLSPGAVITGITPTVAPTATSGTLVVTLTGTGFVYSGGANLVTKAGLVSSGAIVYDSLVTPTVYNSTTITLSIAIPNGTDPYLAAFSGNGGTLTFGVCNPGGTNCSTPASQVNLIVGINPIIQAVTSASSYMQATAPALTPVSAYDILSIFGTNFCVTGGTGCTAAGSTPILYGAPDPANPTALHYLNTLSPDAAGGGQRNLSVTFQTHAATPVAIGTAPLLFATNTQINLVVPSAVAAYIGSTVDIVVNFGANGSINHSAPYSVTIAATDPGVFTVAGDGTGDAAALSSTYSLITSTTPAGARTGSDSDIISLYVTGLGVPDSITGTTAWTGSSTKCMTAANYWVAVNTTDAPSPALTSNDGLVIQSALFPASNIQPCMLHNGTDVPTVTIGGIAAPVQFAGWVSGSIAGLYQINAQIPVRTSSFVDASGNTAPATTSTLTLPVVVTANGIASQPSGVNVYVVGSLLLTATGPVTSGHSGSFATWGSAGGDSNWSVVATEGVGSETYTYSLSGSDTTALSNIGLTLTAAGQITGTVSGSDIGSATVTVIATGGTSGITGTLVVTFTIT